MATATEELPATDEIPEPIPERDDITKAKRQVFGRHMAHEGVMLDRMQRQLRMAEKMQKFASSGDPKDLEWTEEDEAAMGVNIGNEYHIHQQLPAATQSPAKPTSTPTPTEPQATTGWPTKLALAAALAAGSAGIGYIAADQMKPNPATAAGVDTDTDTIVEMDFPEE